MIEPYEEILATGSDYMLKKYAIKLFRIFCRYAQETKYEKYFMLVQESDFSELRDGKALEEKINRIATKIYSSYVNSDVNHVRKEEKKDSALETIKYLHENAIYHNDITSRNVILGDDGKVYILDFGNASSEAKKESNLKASMTSPSNKKHETYKGKVLEKDYRIISMIDKL